MACSTITWHHGAPPVYSSWCRHQATIWSNGHNDGDDEAGPLCTCRDQYMLLLIREQEEHACSRPVPPLCPYSSSSLSICCWWRHGLCGICDDDDDDGALLYGASAYCPAAGCAFHHALVITQQKKGGNETPLMVMVVVVAVVAVLLALLSQSHWLS